MLVIVEKAGPIGKRHLHIIEGYRLSEAKLTDRIVRLNSFLGELTISFLRKGVGDVIAVIPLKVGRTDKANRNTEVTAQIDDAVG